MGRILGIDFGERRLGLAISDELKITAQGLTIWRRKDTEKDLCFLRGIVENYNVDKIVVGTPLDKDGRLKNTFVSEFISMLQENLGLSVDTWDERFTTQEAERMLLEADVSRRKRKRVIDKISAQIILQSYLDYKNNKG
ncbi:MAG: Holliday junction resolvase RuvX [Candidatus Omnitrophota bacterium]